MTAFERDTLIVRQYESLQADVAELCEAVKKQGERLDALTKTQKEEFARFERLFEERTDYMNRANAHDFQALTSLIADIKPRRARPVKRKRGR